MPEIILEYVGGGAFIDGIPARDLTAEDLEGLGWDAERLTTTDLYEFVEDEPDADPAEED
jgi:hypothetical protein